MAWRRTGPMNHGARVESTEAWTLWPAKTAIGTQIGHTPALCSSQSSTSTLAAGELQYTLPLAFWRRASRCRSTRPSRHYLASQTPCSALPRARHSHPRAQHGPHARLAAPYVQHPAARLDRHSPQIRSSGHPPEDTPMHTELRRQGHAGGRDRHDRRPQGRWNGCQHPRALIPARRSGPTVPGCA